MTGQELAGTQLTVGDVLRARVLEAGAQGQPVLMLGGATMAMELPFPVTPGQSLDFTVLEVAPEVRLGVARPADAAAVALVDGGGSDLQISPEALLLSRVTGRLADADPPPSQPLAVRLPGSDAEALLRQPAQLAMALQQGVDRSGVFYERHLAQWMSGQRSAEMLRQEPQSAWPNDAAVRATAATELAARLAASAATGDPAAGLLRQQLEILQQQALTMRTDILPGVSMDWRVRADEDGHRRGQDADARRWEAELGSQLGSLGRVEANLGLAAGRLRISLRAEPEALVRMAAARDDLEAALVGAGLQLVRLQFEPLPAGDADAAKATAVAATGETG